eukprot:g45545.t1
MHGVDHHPAENLTRHCVHAPQLPRALLNAAWEGDVESSTRLLQQGAPVEARNEDGATALILAGNNGHKEVAEALLQAMAEANAKDRDRKSALDLATANGHTAVIELLSNSTQVFTPRGSSPLCCLLVPRALSRLCSPCALLSARSRRLPVPETARCTGWQTPTSHLPVCSLHRDSSTSKILFCCV